MRRLVRLACNDVRWTDSCERDDFSNHDHDIDCAVHEANGATWHGVQSWILGGLLLSGAVGGVCGWQLGIRLAQAKLRLIPITLLMWMSFPALLAVETQLHPSRLTWTFFLVATSVLFIVLLTQVALWRKGTSDWSRPNQPLVASVVLYHSPLTNSPLSR